MVCFGVKVVVIPASWNEVVNPSACKYSSSADVGSVNVNMVPTTQPLVVSAPLPPPLYVVCVSVPQT